MYPPSDCGVTSSPLEYWRPVDADLESGTARRQQVAIRLIGAVFLALLICPTIIVPPGSGVLSRSLSEWLDFGLVGVWMLARILAGRAMAIRPRWLEIALWLPAWAFVLSELVFGARGGDLDPSHLYAVLNVLRPIALVQLLVGICCWGKIDREAYARAHRSLLLIAAIALIYTGSLALLQFFEVRPALNFLQDFYQYASHGRYEIAVSAVEDYGRVTSIFHWANSLGIFVAAGLLLLIPQALTRETGVIGLGATLLGIMTLVLSGSRTAMVALGIGLVVILIIQRRFRVIALLLIGGLFFSAAANLIETRTGASSRLFGLFDWLFGNGPLPGSLDFRLTNLIWSLQQFVRLPEVFWTGTTVTDYRDIVPRSFDSEFLKYLVWTGVFGLVAFVLFQLGVIASAWRSLLLAPKGDLRRDLAASLLATFIAMAVAASNQDVWGQYKLLQLVFVFLGFLVYGNSNSNSPLSDSNG